MFKLPLNLPGGWEAYQVGDTLDFSGYVRICKATHPAGPYITLFWDEANNFAHFYGSAPELQESYQIVYDYMSYLVTMTQIYPRSF